MSNDLTFGYLRFLEDPVVGITGGYLIVTSTGRPLEFHCTAPVTTNRAQEILFGPTLRPYLLGEQVGRALLQRATLTPTVVVIDDLAAVAAVADGEPSLLLLNAAPASSTSQEPSGPWRQVQCAGASAWTNQATVDQGSDWLRELALSIDPAEPFERIEQAIREAQRLGQQESDPH